MKKTLIALMALAGAAFGADYTTETIWTAQFGSAYTGGYTTDLTSPGKFWDADKLATADGAQTSANGRIHMAGGNYGDFATDFELEIELTLTGNLTAGHISELKADSTGDWICLGVDGNGALTLTGKSLTAGTATGTVTTGTAYTLTFVKLGNEVTLTAGDASITATLGTYTGTINNITLGGNTGSGQRVPVLVSGMEMSSATIVPAVPEPTTATLSLLALAGLAARRRRK